MIDVRVTRIVEYKTHTTHVRGVIVVNRGEMTACYAVANARAILAVKYHTANNIIYNFCSVHRKQSDNTELYSAIDI